MLDVQADRSKVEAGTHLEPPVTRTLRPFSVYGIVGEVKGPRYSCSQDCSLDSYPYRSSSDRVQTEVVGGTLFRSNLNRR